MDRKRLDVHIADAPVMVRVPRVLAIPAGKKTGA